MSLTPIIPPSLARVSGFLKPLSSFPSLVKIGNLVMTKTQGGGGAPGAFSFSAVSSTLTTIQVSWTASAGADDYTVYWDTDPSFPSPSSDTLNGTSKNVSGLNSAKAYYFKVVANNGNGSTDWNNLAVHQTTGYPKIALLCTTPIPVYLSAGAGNDLTGEFGNSSKPFASYAGASAAVTASWGNTFGLCAYLQDGGPSSLWSMDIEPYIANSSEVWCAGAGAFINSTVQFSHNLGPYNSGVVRVGDITGSDDYLSSVYWLFSSRIAEFRNIQSSATSSISVVSGDPDNHPSKIGLFASIGNVFFGGSNGSAGDPGDAGSDDNGADGVPYGGNGSNGGTAGNGQQGKHGGNGIDAPQHNITYETSGTITTVIVSAGNGAIGGNGGNGGNANGGNGAEGYPGYDDGMGTPADGGPGGNGGDGGSGGDGGDGGKGGNGGQGAANITVQSGTTITNLYRYSGAYGAGGSPGNGGTANAGSGGPGGPGVNGGNNGSAGSNGFAGTAGTAGSVGTDGNNGLASNLTNNGTVVNDYY